MNPDGNSTDLNDPSRREFLAKLAATGAALTLGGAVAVAQTAVPFGKANLGGSIQAGQPLIAANDRSRVVRIGSERVMPVGDVHVARLSDALHQGLAVLTDREDPADAWHSILEPEDVILLKFNRSAAEQLNTTPPMATLILESLMQAGWAPEQLIVLEARGDQMPVLHKTRDADLRWQGEEVNFGSCGSDSFIAALDQATAIINVPFLKTHHLATMTSCLKNLSHGLIRRPAKFHGGGCNPAIAQIVAAPHIRNKLRLNVVNALRIVMDKGADAGTQDIATTGTLLLSKDPVACDAIGYHLLNEYRAIRKRKPLLGGASLPPQLLTAASMGLGQVDSEKIEMVKIEA